MDAFFSECLLLIPQDEILTTFFAKMEQSNAFSSFLEKLSTTDYENVMTNLQVRSMTSHDECIECKSNYKIDFFSYF